MKAKIQQLRETLISILDDENGVSENTYQNLQAIAAIIESEQKNNLGATKDIFLAVDSADGRFFLPENHGLKIVSQD